MITFIKMPFAEKRLACEIVWILYGSRRKIKSSPFKDLAAEMGEIVSEPPVKKRAVGKSDFAERLGGLIQSVSRWVPFRAMCFEQALTCATLLKKRNIGYTIHFGLKKDDSDNSRLNAHAWTTCDGVIITGKKGYRKYRELVAFYFNSEMP